MSIDWIQEFSVGISNYDVTQSDFVGANMNAVTKSGGNDFEGAVFGRFPQIRAGFEALAGTHPFLCRMSGSGSTLFAVYRTEPDRDDAASRLGGKFGVVAGTQAG